eukprot:GILK01005114.1.p1 GENE.GILK01005114.1~~GILK01005114.1.p1  ORF type:complete len:353 (+),score=63.67 GILK01005114.1:284-1342(+)
MTSVKMSTDAFRACLSHALTTEREEIMGLLLGETEDTEEGLVSSIWAISTLTRLDKRKDRVEISPEQLTNAATEAEKISEKIQRRTRVVGWYHSHPHITVFPSHVDVRTQASYQTMDPGFIGIILSCFNDDAGAKSGRVQVIAFQSVDAAQEKVSPSVSDFQQPLTTAVTGSPDVKESDLYSFISTSNVTGMVRRDVPLYIVPSFDVFQSDDPAGLFMCDSLAKIIDVQKILFREEKMSFEDAIQQPNSRNPLSIIHNVSVYQKSLCKLLEHSCLPLRQAFEDRLKNVQQEMARLDEENRRLRMSIPASVDVNLLLAPAVTEDDVTSPTSAVKRKKKGFRGFFSRKSKSQNL